MRRIFGHYHILISFNTIQLLDLKQHHQLAMEMAYNLSRMVLIFYDALYLYSRLNLILFLFLMFDVYMLCQNGEAVKKSLAILIEGHHIEINNNKRIEIDGQSVELPVAVESQTWIKRTGERILVHSELGIEVECNLHYDICIIELSGWYFGKTGGLLGTFDYEPGNDLSFPNGTAAHTIEAFANSWYVGSAQCHSVNHAALPTYMPTSEESRASESNQCTAYFEDQLSPLRRCFSQVETDPFYQMCLSELAKNRGVCTSVAAYVSQCRRANVDIWIPQNCGE
jgi:hypothetical protein